MDRAILDAAGLDTADALDRMMGSEALLGRLLGTFLKEDTMEKLEAAAAAMKAGASAPAEDEAPSGTDA